MIINGICFLVLYLSPKMYRLSSCHERADSKKWCIISIFTHTHTHSHSHRARFGQNISLEHLMCQLVLSVGFQCAVTCLRPGNCRQKISPLTFQLWSTCSTQHVYYCTTTELCICCKHSRLLLPANVPLVLGSFACCEYGLFVHKIKLRLYWFIYAL